MTEKIDLPYPPEVAALIEMHGGIVAYAEKAAGLAKGYIYKLRLGKKSFTPYIKEKVEAALKGEPMEKTSMREDSLKVPDTCPPLIAELIKAKGSKKAATKVLGTSDGAFYAVLRGERPMPPVWISRAKAALGQSVIGAPRELFSSEAPAQPAAPPVPEFVPWDGKTKGSFTTKPVGQHKARTIKNVPKPILDLIAKFDGSVIGAARSVGLGTGTALLNWMEPGKFTVLKQRKLHAALHGQSPLGADRNSMGESYDKYETGFAICLMKGTNFDRIADIADILNAKVVFRKNTTRVGSSFTAWPMKTCQSSSGWRCAMQKR
jgi:hypothetical protein